MLPLVAWRSVVLGGLMLAGQLVCADLALASQGATPQVEPAAASTLAPGTIEVVRRALQNPPIINLRSDGLRFYMQVLAKRKTFADYMQGTDIAFGRGEAFTAKKPLAAGGRGGFDVLPLILSAVSKAREARRSQLVRRINQQIDRELRALDAAQHVGKAESTETPSPR